MLFTMALCVLLAICPPAEKQETTTAVSVSETRAKKFKTGDKPIGTWSKNVGPGVLQMKFTDEILTVSMKGYNPETKELQQSTVEAEYSVSTEGVVYGYVTSIDFPCPDADAVLQPYVGSAFAFRVRATENGMIIRDMKLPIVNPNPNQLVATGSTNDLPPGSINMSNPAALFSGRYDSGVKEPKPLEIKSKEPQLPPPAPAVVNPTQYPPPASLPRPQFAPTLNPVNTPGLLAADPVGPVVVMSPAELISQPAGPSLPTNSPPILPNSPPILPNSTLERVDHAIVPQAPQTVSPSSSKRLIGQWMRELPGLRVSLTIKDDQPTQRFTIMIETSQHMEGKTRVMTESLQVTGDVVQNRSGILFGMITAIKPSSSEMDPLDLVKLEYDFEAELLHQMFRFKALEEIDTLLITDVHGEVVKILEESEFGLYFKKLSKASPEQMKKAVSPGIFNLFENN